MFRAADLVSRSLNLAPCRGCAARGLIAMARLPPSPASGDAQPASRTGAARSILDCGKDASASRSELSRKHTALLARLVLRREGNAEHEGGSTVRHVSKSFAWALPGVP